MFSFSDVLERIGDSFESFIASLPNFVISLVVFFIVFLLSRHVQRLTVTLIASSGQRQNIAMVLGRLARSGVILIDSLLPSLKQK